ncbi:MAG: SDR family NAD(P)-dependent oxidoreductase [Vicingaceae bacterium]
MQNGIAMVTGANRGIGKAIVSGLVKKGFHVILAVRRESEGKETSLEIDPSNSEVIRLDVTDAKCIKEAAAMVGQKHARLDVLINNAGIIGEEKSTMDEGNIEEIRTIMEVNYFGPMQVNAAFLPLLKKSQDPRIINMSSGMGALDSLTGDYAGYRLSKAGLNAQTIMLANSLKGEVKVFSMCPGWVKTDMGGSNAPRTPELGADTAIWLAEDEAAESGKFYRDRKVIDW